MEEEKTKPALGVELSVENGVVLLSKVKKFGSLGKAGLAAGDTMVAFAGEPVTSMEQVHQILDRHAVGDTVSVTYRRDGQGDQTIDVKLRASKRLALEMEEVEETLERKISP